MAEQPEGLLDVGKIGRPHGVRGDLFIDLTTDRVERAAVGSRLWARDRWLTVSRSAASGTRWRVHFDGLDDRDEAATFTGTTLYAEAIDDPDELWVHVLVGASVVEVSGVERGSCRSVVSNPAADLLELDSGALVPVTFVTNVDRGDAGVVVTIDPPDGLFDLTE